MQRLSAFLKIMSKRLSNGRGIPQVQERVLVIGSSSGIGRAIAHFYSSRGARVCIVGRRKEMLENVKTECIALRAEIMKTEEDTDAILSITADFADATEMAEVGRILLQAWKGIDTVVVSAGASALRPLVEVVGIHDPGDQALRDGVQRAINVSNAAIRANFTGPLVSAATLVPLLETTSSSPSILLISSLAALIPAPTISLYSSTKSASLLLYQSLAIEYPKIKFTTAILSTVQGNFGASAVDQGPLREADPDRHGMKTEYVARECVSAVDAQKRTVLLPYWYCRMGHLVQVQQNPSPERSTISESEAVRYVKRLPTKFT